ncbi:MAG: DUF1501 domain-containing protein [Limnobacter sp.]|nr:DUF1501 domain-containing protein [Limnobacter sp.]
MQELFDRGRCAVLANVGTLVEPTTRKQFREKSVPMPSRLFSHNDQQEYWQGKFGQNTAGVPLGWAGRMADMLFEAGNHSRVPMNISLSGSNLWQSGQRAQAYNMSPYGLSQFFGLDRTNNNWQEKNRIITFDRLMQTGQNNPFSQQYSVIAERAEQLGVILKDSMGNTNEGGIAFPDTDPGKKLRTVLQAIAARNTLGMSRQIFFVGIGGWDSHQAQAANQPVLLGNLSEALKAFYDGTEQLGLAHNVTTFTASDFGRTLSSNGDGTDHGWGGHQ